MSREGLRRRGPNIVKAAPQNDGIGRPRGGSRRFASPEDYRRYQSEIARRAILPILARFEVTLAGKRVLDAGCGAGGMGDVWRREGAEVVGIDRDSDRFPAGAADLVAGDATAMPFCAGAFDFVIGHDIVEHVGDTAVFLAEIARVLAPGGGAFLCFPPFYSAYGGHQQGAGPPGKFMPWGHLMPPALWLRIVRHKAYSAMFAGLARLSIKGFERMAGAGALRVEGSLFYIIRPEVALRTGLPAVEASWLGRMGGVREFLLGGAYYLLRKPA